MKKFNTRLAVRNLLVATVLSVAYLLGKHFRENHVTGDVLAFKISSTKNK